VSSIDHSLRDQRAQRLLFDIRTTADTLHGVVTGAAENEQPWSEGVYTCVAALHRSIGIAQAELADLSSGAFVRFVWRNAADRSTSWAQLYSDLAAEHAPGPRAGTDAHRSHRRRISWIPFRHSDPSPVLRPGWATATTSSSARLVGAAVQCDE
jgi:hypothetical protein